MNITRIIRHLVEHHWRVRRLFPAPVLERIEQAIDAMSIEVERIAEAQRFVTRLMTDRSPERVALPLRGDDHHS